MDSLHLSPSRSYVTTMSTVEEYARSLQGVNEGEARSLGEWLRLSEAERRDEGLLHELHCTLCGAPFWLSWLRSGHSCRGDEDTFAWVNYFFARK